MSNTIPNQDIIEHVIKDPKVRRSVAKQDHQWFFHIYFPHYIEYETAPFQRRMFEITEDTKQSLSIVVAFRGSGKSTIMTLSYPIWAILGKQQRKCIVLVSQTQKQARQHLSNIKSELESNELLKRDLGPFKEFSDEWGMSGLVIPKYDAKIVVISNDQSTRGLRHRQHRPDLIICDDIEDIHSTKTFEGRNKTFEWFNSEIIPLGEEKTKTVVVGNLLHEDSLLMRLKDVMETKDLEGEFEEFPLVTYSGDILWKSRFPTMEHVETLRRKIASKPAWHREYLLEIVSEADRVVHPEWIHFAEHIKYETRPLVKVYFGIDLALTQNQTSDYTAIVIARVHGTGDDMRIYISSRMINERLTFPEAIQTIIRLNKEYAPHIDREIIIESNGYQQAMIQQLEEYGIFAVAFHSTGDKRSRLATASDYIKSGKVLFPKEGARQLIQQITGFGKEKHDDLMDAFTFIIHRIILTTYPNQSSEQCSVIRIDEGYYERLRRLRRRGR